MTSPQTETFFHKQHHSANQRMLYDLQRETFDFFLAEVDPHTGLIADSTQPGAPSSIAVVGMGISAYIMGVEQQFLPKADAIKRILKILRFFKNSPHGEEPDATGYKGFYYHFLEMHTGKRTWRSELSTIDTTFFIAGALSAAAYFKADNEAEKEIRETADWLYRRIDWQWALNGGASISHGWLPESGFLPYRWDNGYSEAMLMYLLAIGSPEFPIPAAHYKAWTATFLKKKLYNIEYIHAGPLFIHQFSHMWVDLKNIKDDFTREMGIDYFENSHHATCIQREYAIENPMGFAHYGPNCWGFTASDGPGFQTLIVDGREVTFYDYIARGIPNGPDDGTVAPWAVVASLPFAPDEVIETIKHAIEKFELKKHRLYGFDASFNPTFPVKTTNTNGWVSEWRFGLNQGPIIIMIQNYNDGTLWKIMKRCPYLIEGLKLAGFAGGWLDGERHTNDSAV